MTVSGSVHSSTRTPPRGTVRSAFLARNTGSGHRSPRRSRTTSPRAASVMAPPQTEARTGYDRKVWQRAGRPQDVEPDRYSGVLLGGNRLGGPFRSTPVAISG